MRHLLVDGLASNLGLLRDKAALCAYVQRLVNLLEMRLMTQPLSIQAEGFGLEAGVTVVAIISESHIAIHTWPEREDFNLNVDLFSCRPFDIAQVHESLRQQFEMQECKSQVIERPLFIHWA